MKTGIVVFDLSTPSLIKAALKAVTLYNILWLRENPNTPRILSFAKYRKEDMSKGFEDILTIPGIIAAARRGAPIDCEDLACAWAAEETTLGRPTDAIIIGLTHPEYSDNLIHVVAENLQTKKITDVSVIAGMPNNLPVGTTITRL